VRDHRVNTVLRSRRIPTRRKAQKRSVSAHDVVASDVSTHRHPPHSSLTLSHELWVCARSLTTESSGERVSTLSTAPRSSFCGAALMSTRQGSAIMPLLGVKYIATGYCITRRHLSAPASAHSRRGGVVFTHAPFTGFTGCYSRSPRFPSSSSSLGARAPLANGAISASLQWPRASTRTRDGAPAPCDTAAPSWPATRCSASRTRRPPAPPVAPDAPGTAGSWCPGSRCPAPCR